ncbi:hypothetical protein EVAR_32218_1 [Eumeta japonica]|uniref:Uncharacterized protein n=1 Tax=Eumeta variegata TaxID=151549 RepID=A0A4C1VZB3_EUMVA|nr:hypothetical protein EVAR_32218_1 [Eumeta japonica]
MFSVKGRYKNIRPQCRAAGAQRAAVCSERAGGGRRAAGGGGRRRPGHDRPRPPSVARPMGQCTVRERTDEVSAEPGEGAQEEGNLMRGALHYCTSG